MSKAVAVGLRVRLPKGTQIFAVTETSDSFVKLAGETTGAEVTTTRLALENLLQRHPEYEQVEA